MAERNSVSVFVMRDCWMHGLLETNHDHSFRENAPFDRLFPKRGSNGWVIDAIYAMSLIENWAGMAILWQFG